MRRIPGECGRLGSGKLEIEIIAMRMAHIPLSKQLWANQLAPSASGPTRYRFELRKAGAQASAVQY